jgi:hypothetical protein
MLGYGYDFSGENHMIKRAAGMSISIFNPTFDWDGSLAKKLVAIIARGLQNV